MKSKLLLWLLLLCSGSAWAQNLSVKESFEDSNGDYGYTSNTFTTNIVDPSTQYFFRSRNVVTVPGSTVHSFGAPSTPASMLNVDGTYFWACEGVRGTGNTTPTAGRDPGVVTLNAINNSQNYTNLKVIVAAGDPRSGTNIARETDHLRVQYAYGSASGPYTTLFEFTGSNPGGSSSWTRVAVNGTNVTGTAAILSANFSDHESTIPAGSGALYIRVEADYQGSNKEVAFDNIRVTGTVSTVTKPTIASNVGTSTLTFAEGTATPLTVFSDLAVGNPAISPNPTLTEASVSITPYAGMQDELTYTIPGGITAATSTAGSTYTITFSSATPLSVSTYEALLESVKYRNTNVSNATAGDRTLSFAVKSGTAASIPLQRIITVTTALNGASLLPYPETFDADGEGTRYASNTRTANSQGFLRLENASGGSATPGSGFSNGGITTFTNVQGPGYWYTNGAKSGIVIGSVGRLTLAPVNSTGYANLHFKVRAGESSSSNSFGNTDFLRFSYSTDGTNFTVFANYTGAGGFLRLDGNTANPALGSALANLDFALPTSLAGTAIQFRVETASDGGEQIVFDDILITGTQQTTVNSIVRASANPTNAATVNYTVTFGAPVTGLTASNFTLTTIGLSGAMVGTPVSTGTGSTWTVPVTTGTGSGPLTLNLDNDTGLSADINNTLPFAGETYTIDKAAPTATIARQNPTATATNATAVTFRVTFSEAVTGVSTGSFTLNTTGTSGTIASVTSVGGSTSVYDVVVNGVSGNGTLGLSLKSTGSGVSDAAGNAATGMTGPTYTIDQTAPTVTFTSTPPALSNSTSATFTFTGNDGTGSGVASFQASLNGAAYLTVTSPLTFSGLSSGSYTVQVRALDNAGNVGTPVSYTFTIDQTAPTVTSLTSTAGASGSSTSTTPFPFSVSFSESVTGFAASGITVNNGSVTSGPTGSGSGPYTFTVTPTTAGTPTTVTIAANAVQDAVGNNNPASATYSLTYLLPSVTVSSVTGRTPTPTATATVSYRVTFSGSLSGLSTSNFNLTTTGAVSGASVASVSGSGATYIVVVNTGTGNGTLRLNVNSSTGTSPGITGLPNTSGTVYTLIRNNTFAANPQLTIQAGGSPGGNSDVTAFVDVVQVLSGGTPVAGALQNASFETSNVGPAGYKYGPQVSAAPWDFNTQAGVARNGSGFGAVVPPQGDAVAFIQSSPSNNGSIAQNMDLPTGSYQVSLQASQRVCCGNGPFDQELYVLVNGVCLGIIQPTNTSGYDAFTSQAFNVRATSRVAGQLLRFSGGSTAGYADFSASVTNPAPILGGTYTQTAWIKPSIGTGSVTYYVLGNGTGGNTAAPYLAVLGNGRLEAGFGSSAGLQSKQTSPQTIASGVWSYVAATYDGSTLRIYLNGEEQTNLSTSNAPASTRVNYVGSAGTGGSNYFPGDIDELTQWNRALSQTEIRLLRHLTLSGVETGLVSYLQFNDAGTTTTDVVSGAVGTLTSSGVTRAASTAAVGYGTNNLQTVAANTTYNFPGTNLSTAFAGVTGSFETVVFRLDGQPLGTQPTNASLKNLFTQAYWIVDKYSGGSFTSANVTYTLNSTSISAADAATPANLKLFKRGSNDDGAFDAPISATSANAAAGTVTFPLTSFGQTVIGTFGTSPLPVELVQFTAERVGNDGLLRWATAQERNNAYFEVESGTDGHTFRPVGRVAGAGTSSSPHSYSLIDANLARYAAGTVYYRLRQVDLDGTESFSPLRTVQVPAGAALAVEAAPNPFQSILRLTIRTAEAGPAMLYLTDGLGRQLSQRLVQLPAGTSQLVLDEAPALSTGLYVLRIKQGVRQQTLKLVRE